MMDLIFAEATPPGRGGVSVIRLSGAGARMVAEGLVGAMPVARHAYFRPVTDAEEVLDQALCLWFEERASFTGEESAEIHLHGAPAIVRRVMTALMHRGARLAEAGEFTRRAFLNGRMDLIEVEGLGDLLAAETELQRRQAVRAASGEVTRKVERWRDSLVRAGALIEASIDFADEEVPEVVPAEVFEIASALSAEMDAELAGFAAAERVAVGFEVAIVGPPNAGKSSLMNALAKRDVAIVSDIAGTTRDVIELRMEIDGLAVTILDTAGLRESADAVERIGVERARQRAETADLRLHLGVGPGGIAELWKDGDLVVQSKADLGQGDGDISVSAVTGRGIGDLLSWIGRILTERVAGAGLVTKERQYGEVLAVRDALRNIDVATPPEILAEHVRAAAAALGRVVGRIAPDDYLDHVFSRFCIGK